jgi:hypothetical protein
VNLSAFERVGRGRGGLDALLDDLAEVDRRSLDRELPRLDLREEEQVVDEVEQAVRVAIDDFEVAAAAALRRVEVLEEKLDVPADRGQRRAQLVRDE